jgi:hypothetical protein
VPANLKIWPGGPSVSSFSGKEEGYFSHQGYADSSVIEVMLIIIVLASVVA